MIREIGKAVEKKDGKVVVEFDKDTQRCKVCHLNFLCNFKKNLVTFDTEENLNCGDKVMVEIEEKKSVLSALILFFMPSFLFISLLISLKGLGQINSFFLSFLGIGIYFFILKIILIKILKNRLNVRIKRI